MGRTAKKSRAKQREELLRELAADEAVYISAGVVVSRAVEAVEALQRIGDGSYGVCVDCDGKIPPGRLQIKPEATRCVTCQSTFEQRATVQQGEPSYATRRSA